MLLPNWPYIYHLRGCEVSIYRLVKMGLRLVAVYFHASMPISTLIDGSLTIESISFVSGRCMSQI